MLAVIVLAAGEGKRLQSAHPKILHSLGGMTVVEHVLKAAKELNPQQLITVISPHLIEKNVFKETLCVVQDQPLGTGDAVRCAMSALSPSIQSCLIICGDTPLITKNTLLPLVHSKADISLIGMVLQTDSQKTLPYGRIACDLQGIPECIIEYKDALHQGSQDHLSNIANSSIYHIRRSFLEKAILVLKPSPTTGEYYLTDILETASKNDLSRELFLGPLDVLQGVNTRLEMAEAFTHLQTRWRKAALERGVTMLSPDHVVLSYDTVLDQDSIVEPYVHFGPGVHVESHAHVRSFSYLENTVLKSYSQVGPFSHLRGGATLASHAQVGNFVEIKGSTLGEYTKAKHLSYLGDASIGSHTNIGAGVITANYDGYHKFQTHVASHVSIGANSVLMAPIFVEEGSIIAAGTLLKKNIPAHALAIGRSQVTIKEGWAASFHQKKKSSPL